MDIKEYKKVMHLNYDEYCDYLQEKRGMAKYDYMTKSWNKNTRCTRTKEGLIAHHKYEKYCIMLSTKEFAMLNPFEYQLAKNIIYCDYLEHLLCHVLISESPLEEKNNNPALGIGGIINFIAPELNDLYSGWATTQEWRKNCHDLVRNDKDVYLTIIKRFKYSCSNNPFYSQEGLLKSFNEQYGHWSSEYNKAIYDEIKLL